MQRAVRREGLLAIFSGRSGTGLAPRRFWMLKALCLSVLLFLMPAGAQAQTQPAAGKAKVDRLVLGLIEKYRDYWRPWINGSADHMIQHDPVFEWLVEVALTASISPGWPIAGR